MPIDEHGHRCGNAMSAAFFRGGKRGRIARFASERAPTGKDELAQEHDMGLARESCFAAMQENFCWERPVYTEIGFESALRYPRICL